MGAEREGLSEKMVEALEKAEIAGMVVGGGLVILLTSSAGTVLMFGSAIAYAATRQLRKKN